MKSARKKDRNTLFSQLLLTILPIALIPLAIASALGFYQAQERSISSEFIKLQKDANLISEASQLSVDKALSISWAIAESSTKIDLIKSTSDRVVREKLLELSIEEREKRAKKILPTNKELNNHLKLTAQRNGFARMTIAEKNGFNVAVSDLSASPIGGEEKSWHLVRKRGWFLGNPEPDRANKATVIPIVKSINDPTSNRFLGVVKADIYLAGLEERIKDYISGNLTGSHAANIIDTESGAIITHLCALHEEHHSSLSPDDPLIKIGRLLSDSQLKPDRLKQAIAAVPAIEIEDFQIDRNGKVQVTIEYQNRIWSLRTIPLTQWISVASIDTTEILAPAIELLAIFSTIGLLLGGAAVWTSFLLARHLSQPIHELTDTARQMAAGNLDLRANEINGTTEVRALALAFNELVDRVNGLLSEQKQQSEALEAGIWQLVEDVEGLLDGDLTVRAGLDSMEMSTVADLFNAAIENLRDIAIEVRNSIDGLDLAISSSEMSSNELLDSSTTTATQIDRTLLAIATISAANQSISTHIARFSTLPAPSIIDIDRSALTESNPSIATFLSTQLAAIEEIERILSQVATTTAASDRLAADMKASIQSTAEIARNLSAKVDRFKV